MCFCSLLVKKYPEDDDLYDASSSIKSSGSGIVRIEQELLGAVTTILVFELPPVQSWILCKV